MASELPEELWRRILELGVQNSLLSHKDLCCVSISCSRLHRLSSDSSLWSTLLDRDFLPSNPGPSSFAMKAPPPKSLYKTKFERDKARKLASWRVSVLNLESQVAVCSKNMEELRSLLSKEDDKWKAAATELGNLENVRRATVALNVWQPEVIRTSQKNMVEQCNVPIESRISALQMEVKLCKQQIAIYKKAYNYQKGKLEERKEELASLKYHPIHSFQLQKSVGDSNRKRKRWK